MSSSHSHSEFSESSDHVRLPLTTSRRKYVFHDEANSDRAAVDVKMKWRPKIDTQRCDLDLCAVVFDFEGNVMDGMYMK